MLRPIAAPVTDANLRCAAQRRTNIDMAHFAVLSMRTEWYYTMAISRVANNASALKWTVSSSSFVLRVATYSNSASHPP